MSIEFWVTVPFDLNRQVFVLWVEGMPAAHTTELRNDHGGFPAALVNQDTEDQYMQFEYFRPWLLSPPMMLAQVGNVFSKEACEYMVLKFYAYDELFMREIAGKPLDRKVCLFNFWFLKEKKYRVKK